MKMTHRDFVTAYKDMNEGMKQNLNKTSGSGLLKDYSPWLQAFQTSNYTESIEVPGQPSLFIHYLYEWNLSYRPV